MIKHYVKVALRLIKRSFLFSSINMLGFVFGMAAAFLIYLWVVDRGESRLPDYRGETGAEWGNKGVSFDGTFAY